MNKVFFSTSPCSARVDSHESPTPSSVAPFIKNIFSLLAFFCSSGFAAQEDCIDYGITHFEAEMPKNSFEWFFFAIDDQHSQASLIFPSKINGATFFQALAQKEDESHYEYAFPLEVLDHPVTTEAKEIEFIISNVQLSDLRITIQYLEEPYLECSGKKSFTYYVKPS